MNHTGRTAAAAGGAGTSGILLVKLFAYYGVTLTTPEAIAMVGLLAPVLHGAVDVFSAMKSALIARITPKT